MLEILVAVLPVLGLGVGLWVIHREDHSYFRRKGQEAALACGLSLEETSVGSSSWSLKSQAGPIQVRIVTARRKGYGPHFVVTAPWPPELIDIRIHPEVKRSLGVFEAREVEIGDDAFDRAFCVEGPERLLFALLDGETRRVILAASSLYSGTLEIACGELRSYALVSNMKATLRLLLEIAQRFTRPLDIAQRLAANARQDPVEEVRLRNLLLLAREFPGEPGTLEVLRTACAGTSLRIRLRAAQALGDEGHKVLLDLAVSSEDDIVSSQAVASLGSRLSLERIRTILAQALHHHLLATARICLKTLGNGGAPEDVETLAEVLELEKSDLAVTAAEALGETGSPAAEPLLLAALQKIRTEPRIAVAKALARIGTVAAVLPLKEIAESTSHPELRGAARQAVAEIQSRLQGASPGQLSLAGGEAGKLSLAETEAGELSLAEDADGHLSLPPG